MLRRRRWRRLTGQAETYRCRRDEDERGAHLLLCVRRARYIFPVLKQLRRRRFGRREAFVRRSARPN